MHYKKGSTHVIIISLLTLALIGALGWIFWQNFVNKSSPQSPSSAPRVVSSNSNNTVTNGPSQETEGNLSNASKNLPFKIDQWKVGAKYSVDNVVIKYELEGNSVNLLGDKLVGQQYCKYGYSGAIRRYKFDETMTLMDSSKPLVSTYAKEHPANGSNFVWSRVGDYYYWYTSPQATCSDSMANYETDAIRQAKSVVMNLEAL